MAIEAKFIKDKIKWMEIEEFLKKEFSRAGYSHCDVQRTPLALRIVVYTNRPGLIIGRGGKTIESLTKVLREKFGLENPQLEVEEIENPYLDANIVAKRIASSIERGINYKRVVNLAIERIMESGAVGVSIRVSGKLGGEMARTEKFSAGYLQNSGYPAEKFVRKAYATAKVKLGVIGIQVRILTEVPKEVKVLRELVEGGLDVDEKQGN